MGSLSSFAADSSGALHEDPLINSYVRVERLDCKSFLAFFSIKISSHIYLPPVDLVTRPVLIIGPLAEAVVDKLLSDYPHKFSRCKPTFTPVGHEVIALNITILAQLSDHENNDSHQDLERGVLENSVIEFKRRGSNYECTTVESVRDICDRVSHGPP